MSKPNQEANDEKAPQKSIKDRFIDGFVIVVLVAASTATIDYLRDKNTAAFTRDNKAYLDSVQTDNRVFLDSMVKLNKFQYDTATRNLIARQEKAMLQLSGSIERENEINKIKEQLTADISKINSQHQRQIELLIEGTRQQREKQISEIQLDFVGKQLSEFYWPIYSRLEKRQSLKSNSEGTYINDRIDTLLQLKNHLEIIDILETNMHLATPDEDFISASNKYIEYVGLFESFKKMKFVTIPDELDLVFPDQFYDIVKERTLALQQFYNSNYLNRYGMSQVFDSLPQPDRKVQNIVSLSKVTGPRDVSDTIITVKKSWNDVSFFNKVDEKFQIVFLEYIPGNSLGYFDFQFVDNNGNIKNNRQFVKPGEMVWVDSPPRHYQIYFEEVYSVREKVVGQLFKKDRIVARFRLKKW